MDFSHDFGSQQFQHDLAFAEQDQPRFHHEFEQVSTIQDQAYAISLQKMSCDVKPRLTKEQHDILEAHYLRQQKPNTSTKRGFAESLNVSLEKVNNWFQNRRAKSKQDAKKQQSSINVFSTQQPSQVSINTSDSDTSPAFASPEYTRMMQQMGVDEDSAFTFGAEPVHSHVDVPLAQPQHHNFNLQAMNHDLLSTSQELNRRTLTQEQFDAFSQHGDLMLSSGDFANLAQSDPEALNKLMSDYSNGSLDFSNMQVNNNQDMLNFSLMQGHALSVPESEWAGSRSSSASVAQSVDSAEDVLASQVSNQWQPGQSVPVDVNQLNQEFREVAQARQQPEGPMIEEPLAWPSEYSLERRDSTTSLLAHSMGNVGIQTPQPQQQATFKSPTPVSSLAARRQRQRPAPLGLASLRSQSYSGNPQSASPGHMQQSNLSVTPQLRRIKSSNVIGGIAQGRVQKNVAPPQRSPLNWSFTDAMVSPQAIRHNTSNSALAPPTPASPDEAVEQAIKAQQWQATQINRHDSISETDAEHMTFHHPLPQNFSSPPHTPMFNMQQQFIPPQPITGNIIMENTPPQSAPASQQCFPPGIFMPSPPQMPQHQHHHSQPFVHPMQPPVPIFMPQQPMMAEPQMMAQPQFTVTGSGQPIEMAMHFGGNGVPIVDAQGQIQVAMPSQLQFVQQKVSRSMQPPKAPAVQPTAASMQTTFATTVPETISVQVTAQVPKHSTQPSSDFFVHEYTPPHDVKRAATPRKPVNNGPKSYTFANQTPEHFEKGKKSASDKTSTESSPLSSES